jgi:type I restriction enzyme M protein
MRKSLGSKRKLLSEAQIADIARLHDGFAETPTSKIFNTTDFGYRRITVERPLRLRFTVNAENLALYRAAKGAEQSEAFAALLDQAEQFDDLPGFLKAAHIKKLGKAGQKAVLSCFGTKCAEAEIVKDTDGKPLADPDLRENENVPLNQDIHAYFAREVLPHVPDAWIDDGKRDDKDGQIGIVGYEINFNRYFYQYQPPRQLADIDADLKAVEAEIAALLNEVTA